MNRKKDTCFLLIFCIVMHVFCRLYVRYLRNIAEKTDFGRLAGPSLLRLVDEAAGLSGSSSSFNGKLSSEIWDSLQRVLEVVENYSSVIIVCIKSVTSCIGFLPSEGCFSLC